MKCESCGHENVEGARFCANCGITQSLHVDTGNPLVGKMVGGRFRVTGVIGEGGMGIVYAAEQQMGSAVRKVAVKTLHKELSADPSVTARFHRECGTVAQLEHPNTIKVYDFGAMDDGTLYIAMEFIDGKPLDRVIEESGSLSPERVMKLLRQVSGSLEEAHKLGIIHRDLKPENVVLTERAGERDVVKLLDFGIAARTESADAAKEAKLTQQGMVLGTPPYMSPEQFTGKALDRRSDIYSLAVMAYQMLTGKLPFDANTPWEWATEHMTAQPRPFETMSVSTKIPGGMRYAILKALSKDRDERYATVSEFVAAMDQAPPGSAVAAPPSGDGATAAMAAVPDFGAPAAVGAAPTAAMPAQPVRPLASAPGVHVPAPPPNTAKDGGNKGLIYGLGGLAVLLVGGLAVALVGGGGDDAAPIDLALTSEPAATSAPVAETSEPETPEEPEVPSVPEDVSPPPSDRPSTPTGPQRPKPAPSASSEKPPEKPPTPTPKPTPVPTPPPTTGDACKQCISLASSGAITSAAVQFQSCSNASDKSQCSARARQRAPAAAKRAATQKDCSKARQIQAAANSMNAGSGALDAQVAACN